jgi:Putative transposase/Transposase zinc-binding domain
MRSPCLEVADIVRMHGDEFLDGQPGWFTYQHLTVYRAITACRTQALGGHLDQCSQCGYRAISYCSCRNRHCPKCQTNARNKWLAARSKELLDVGYFHVVFTLPHQFSGLALQNKRVIYDLLFRTCAETLLEVAAAPSTWAPRSVSSPFCIHGDRICSLIPHIHCVIPSGGLSPDHTAWVHPRYHFFLPVEVLSRVFRGKFTDALKRAFRKGKLVFHGRLRCLSNAKMFRIFLRSVFPHDWVVYAKEPFGGPEHVLHYLARYTHRVAISNHRLISLEDGKVTFRWKDYAHGNKQRKMTVGSDEFLRRFFLHVLPRGFVRIRFFGFLANRSRANMLPLCRRLLEMPSRDPMAAVPVADARPPAGWKCPCCSGSMVMIGTLTARQLRWMAFEQNTVDTS